MHAREVREAEAAQAAREAEQRAAERQAAEDAQVEDPDAAGVVTPAAPVWYRGRGQKSSTGIDPS